jgi:hypothetical protein
VYTLFIRLNDNLEGISEKFREFIINEGKKIILDEIKEFEIIAKENAANPNLLESKERARVQVRENWLKHYF